MSGTRRSRWTGAGAWALVLVLAYPWIPTRADGSQAASLGRRLFGPVASLAASAEWVRFSTALGRGETDRAYGIAGSALAFDPWSPYGWVMLSEHLIFDRATSLTESDPLKRVQWAALGLELLRRGEVRSAEPGPLAVIQGLNRVRLGDLSGEEMPWPGGDEALYRLAIADFQRAIEYGHPHAAEFLAAAEARLAELQPEEPPR